MNLGNFMSLNDRLIVKQIKDQTLDMFHYIGISLEDNRFKPCESVMVTHMKTGVKFPAIVYPEKGLLDGEVSISTELSRSKTLEKDSILEIKPLYNLTPIEGIKILPLSVDEEDTVKGEARFSLSKKLFNRLKYTYIGHGHQIQLQGHWYKLEIKDVYQTYGQINQNTTFYYKESVSLKETSSSSVYKYLSQLIEWPIYYKKEFQKLEIESPKGIILHGPPGCGKTHILREVLQNSKLKVFHIKGPELLSKFVGGSESALRKVFTAAKESEPSVILFDQIDAIATKRGDTNENEAKLVSQLLSCMDGIVKRGSTLVIATTNTIEKLDPALRRPGRFDKEFLIRPPDIDERKSLFETFLKTSSGTELDLAELAHKTNGYVHADIKLLCNHAKLNVISRTEDVNKDYQLVLKMSDFESAFKSVPPSLLRSYISQEYTNTTAKPCKLDDIKGYATVKETLYKQISFPQRYPDLYKSNNVKSVRGVLLTGPPGTGKTTLAKALASELNHNFIFISGTDLLSKYVGETEQKIAELFQKARATQPCIIFIDEIDGLFGASRTADSTAGHESSKLGTFLSQMDGLSSNVEQVIIIGTTNKPQLLDSALVRAGRFELKLEMDYPTKAELLELFGFYFKDWVGESFDWSEVINLSHKHKYVGSDVAALKRVVLMNLVSGSNPKTINEYTTQSINVPESLILEAIREFNKHKDNDSTGLKHDY